MIDAFLAALTLQGGYNTSVVLVGSALLGLAAGPVGVFAVLRRRALVADAIAHATLPGIAGAFLFAVWLGLDGRSLPILLTGAAVAGALGAISVQAIRDHTRLTEDTAIGTVLSVFFGLGAVLLGIVQTTGAPGQAGLNSFLLGQTAALSRAEAELIGVSALAILLAVTLLFRALKVVAFDQEFAQAQGWPVGRIDFGLTLLILAVAVIGLKTVGLVLIVALLIIPPVAARMWTDRLPFLVMLAGLFGAASGYIGAGLSAALPNLPAGSMIVLSSAALFAFSLLFAPARGVVAIAFVNAKARRAWS